MVSFSDVFDRAEEEGYGPSEPLETASTSPRS